ncbi:MAG: hypothetical protein Q9221_009157 [Calogaya cf. arnoldii]
MAATQAIDYFNDKLPNEITIKILSCLSTKSLKRARFVSKKLASLGGQILVVNLYLSPREKDMEVFDAVTQHPDLKKSVRNIIFDSAQFVKYTLPEYLKEQKNAYEADEFTELGQAKAGIDRGGVVMREGFAESIVAFSSHISRWSNSCAIPPSSKATSSTLFMRKNTATSSSALGTRGPSKLEKTRPNQFRHHA